MGNSRRPYDLVSSCGYYSGTDSLVGAGGRKCARSLACYAVLASVLWFQHEAPEEIPETANGSQGYSAALHHNSFEFHEKYVYQSLLTDNNTDIV